MPKPPIVLSDKNICCDIQYADDRPYHQAFIADRLRKLLIEARMLGFVITVELETLEPLAMGNYRMRGLVRGAR